MRRLEELLRLATEPEESRESPPRALLLFAHPDDEVIGLGARLGRFGSAHFVHVTDGAPADEIASQALGFSSLEGYRRARRAEFEEVQRLAGIRHATSECLFVPDQTAALHLETLSRRIEEILRRRSPEVVFTHSYEGGHPDHDACAFAVQHAAARLGSQAPVIIEAAGYHTGAVGRARRIETNTFLPAPEWTPSVQFRLTSRERTRKGCLLDAFATQRDTLSAFRGDLETFRIAPRYDFARTPHPGTCWYDHRGWAVTSTRFCTLARQAVSLPETLRHTAEIQRNDTSA